jgi:peptidoglycan/xylan/chitin deacetylase (PgdA/CDA1 family)
MSEAPTAEIVVVIPTYNAAERVRTCIEGLSAQTLDPSAFAVLVVVDGSSDGTEQMLAGLHTPFRLRVVRQENQGPGAARNHGATLARAPYVLFLDDDVAPGRDLVAEHLGSQRRLGGAQVIGRLETGLPPRAGRFLRSRAADRAEHYAALRAGRAPTWKDVYSGNLSVPTEPFLAAGGFATETTSEQDVELGYRLAVAGIPIVYVDAAIGEEREHKGAAALARDAEVRGAVDVDLWRRHPEMLLELELGGHGELPWQWLALRRVALVLHLPPRLLDLIGNVLPARRAGAWYRFLYTYCYWRGARGALGDRDLWRRIERGTPILMYHAIGARGERASRYVLPERRFRRQLHWLRLRGYRVVSLDELLWCKREFRLLPAKSVVITFDDGYEDNATRAAPALLRHRFPATFFLVSARSHNLWVRDESHPLSRRRLVDAATVGTLTGAGISIGAHTRTHPSLTDLSDEDAESEIAGSRADLEESLGQPVTVFAYPFGHHDERVRALVERAGFEGACSVEPGRNRLAVDRFRLRRLEVFGTHSLPRFAARLWLGDVPLLRPRQGKGR